MDIHRIDLSEWKSTEFRSLSGPCALLLGIEPSKTYFFHTGASVDHQSVAIGVTRCHKARKFCVAVALAAQKRMSAFSLQVPCRFCFVLRLCLVKIRDTFQGPRGHGQCPFKLGAGQC